MKTRKVRLKRKDEPEKVTRKGTVLFVVLLVLAVIGFVVGVRVGVARKDAKLLGSSDMKTRGLYYQLKMEKTHYRLGEPIKVDLTITNVSASPIPLKFQKNLEFELTVRKEVDLLFAQVPKTIWKLSENQMVYADAHDSIIDPGKTLEFHGVWDQKDREGKPVKPGNYQIIGNLMADDRPESLALRGKTEQ
jgi:hypothetical protein